MIITVQDLDNRQHSLGLYTARETIISGFFKIDCGKRRLDRERCIKKETKKSS